MTNGEKTKLFLNIIPTKNAKAILENIANWYGITTDAAYAEVTDPEAEWLLEYVTGATRNATYLLWKRAEAFNK